MTTTIPLYSVVIRGKAWENENIYRSQIPSRVNQNTLICIIWLTNILGVEALPFMTFELPLVPFKRFNKSKKMYLMILRVLYRLCKACNFFMFIHFNVCIFYPLHRKTQAYETHCFLVIIIKIVFWDTDYLSKYKNPFCNLVLR